MSVLNAILNVIETRLQADTNLVVAFGDREGVNASPTHNKVIVQQKTKSRNERLSCPGNPPAVAYDVTINLNCFTRVENTTTQTLDEAYNAIALRVSKLITNGLDWHRFDGNAINATIGMSYPFTGANGDNSGIVLPLLVTYRVSELDEAVKR